MSNINRMAEDTQPNTVPIEGPVTVAVTWHIRPGREAAFSEWVNGITSDALRFPGHLGINIMRPSSTGKPFVLIFRFASYPELRAWEQSTERATWIARSIPLRTRDPEVQTTTGLEYWFTVPDSRTPPPARWKMAIVTGLALYPLVNILGLLLRPLLGVLNPWLASLVTIPITIALMTYIVMPQLTRLLSRWLFAIPHD